MGVSILITSHRGCGRTRRVRVHLSTTVATLALSALFGSAPASAAPGLPPSVRPVPVGPGAAYRPIAAVPAVLAGRPVNGMTCGSEGRRFGVHLELFAHRRVVVLPAGIGVARPFVHKLGRIVPRGCTYGLRTLTPTGVVEVQRGRRWRLGDLFRLWGRPLGPARLVGFHGTGRLAAFVGGKRWAGDPRSIPLTKHSQIVLELDGYLPPHPTFLFREGL
jgi:hypothetical protein